MISKKCELSDKDKLKVVLHGFCYSYIDPEEAKRCDTCSYKNSWNYNISERINRLSDEILKQTRRSRANYLMVSPEIVEILDELAKK